MRLGVQRIEGQRIPGRQIGLHRVGLLNAFFGLVACASLGLAAPAAAEDQAEQVAHRAAWDQARVTKLATQLATAANELYDAWYKLPIQAGSGSNQNYYRVKNDVRTLRRNTRYLATRLQAGAGFDETKFVFNGMGDTVNDAVNTSRLMGTIPDDVLAKAAPVRDLISQLTPYFGEVILPPKAKRAEDVE